MWNEVLHYLVVILRRVTESGVTHNESGRRVKTKEVSMTTVTGSAKTRRLEKDSNVVSQLNRELKISLEETQVLKGYLVPVVPPWYPGLFEVV